MDNGYLVLIPIVLVFYFCNMLAVLAWGEYRWVKLLAVVPGLSALALCLVMLGLVLALLVSSIVVAVGDVLSAWGSLVRRQ